MRDGDREEGNEGERNCQIYLITFVRTEDLQIKAKFTPLICLDFLLFLFCSLVRMCFGFFEELLYFLEGSTSVWLSLTSVYLQNNNGMLCRAWKDPGLLNPRCQQKERQICGRNAVHTTPTTSTHSRHHLHIITFIPAEPELGWPQNSQLFINQIWRVR